MCIPHPPANEIGRSSLVLASFKYFVLFLRVFFYSFFAKANMENEGVEDDCPFQKSKCDFLGSMLNFVGSKLFNFDGTVGLVCALWFVQIAGDS